MTSRRVWELDFGSLVWNLCVGKTSEVPHSIWRALTAVMVVGQMVRVRREKKANEELHDHMMKKNLTWERRAALRESSEWSVVRIY